MVAMTRSNIDAMPLALEELANQIQSPDDVPMLCLLDAAEMIRELRKCVADAIRRPLGVVPDSAAWISFSELNEAEKRRTSGLVSAIMNEGLANEN